MTQEIKSILSDPSSSRFFNIEEETSEDLTDLSLISFEQIFLEKVKQTSFVPSHQKKLNLDSIQREWSLKASELHAEITTSAISAAAFFKKGEQALEFCSSLGAGLLGAPQKIQSPNQSPTDAMTRLVMRHPKKEAIELLHALHQSFKQKFWTCEDEGLVWLLDVNAKTARGGFQSAQSLRKFLAKNPKTISSSRLITGMNSLLTALAYRNIGAARGTLPYDPETAAQKEVFSRLKDIQPVEDIDKLYPDKNIFVPLDQSHNPLQHLYVAQRADLSDVSDGEELNTQEQLPSHSFYRHKNGIPTWLSIAHAGFIDVRLTQSGSAPLACAAAEWLLKEIPLYSLPENRSRTIHLLAGAVLIPAYVRGDYHSPTETAVGIQHYLSASKIDPENPLLSPYQALLRGIDWMIDSTDEPYKYWMDLLGKDILLHSHDLPYPAKGKKIEAAAVDWESWFDELEESGPVLLN